MLNKNELKQKLITTGYFVDNEYLDMYLDLIYEHEIDSTRYSEKHHVIPVALYKINNAGCNRRKAEKFANADSDNFEVLLLYKDHCLAHYLLYFCTVGALKNNMQCVVHRLISMINILSSKAVITEKLPSEDELAQMQQWRDSIQQDKDSQYWTTEEVDFLVNNYPTEGSAYCAEVLNRTRRSVCAKAFLLNLSCSYPETSGKHWTEEENNILKNNYGKPGGVALCFSLLDRSKQNIINHARRLGLKSAKGYTQEEISFIQLNYKTHGAKFCGEHLGRPSACIRSYYHNNKHKFNSIEKE